MIRNKYKDEFVKTPGIWIALFDDSMFYLSQSTVSAVLAYMPLIVLFNIGTKKHN